jgi:hypothetical protein
MRAADMASVQELLGPHAYALARYGFLRKTTWRQLLGSWRPGRRIWRGF